MSPPRQFPGDGGDDPQAASPTPPPDVARPQQAIEDDKTPNAWTLTPGHGVAGGPFGGAPDGWVREATAADPIPPRPARRAADLLGATAREVLPEEPTIPLPLEALPAFDFDETAIPLQATPPPTPATAQGPLPSAVDQRGSGEVGEVVDDDLEILDTPGPVIEITPSAMRPTPPLGSALVAVSGRPASPPPAPVGRVPAAPRTSLTPPPAPATTTESATAPATMMAMTPAEPVAAADSQPPLLPPGAAWSEALAQRPRKKRLKPWFEEVFDEDYLRTLPFMTPEQTLREVHFIREALGAPHDGQILDVGCGYGRHAIELGQQGLRVTGVDLSLPLLIRAADESQRRSLSVNFVHADMREMAFDGQFDGAYCMLTTFGYFDEETNLKVASSICRALKPGGRFLVDAVNRDYVVSDLPTRVWWEGDGCVVLEEVDFNFHTSRIAIRRSVVFQDGRQLEHDISIRSYSLHELGKLLRQAGFRVLEVSGSLATRGHFFGATSRSILMVCERPIG